MRLVHEIKKVRASFRDCAAGYSLGLDLVSPHAQVFGSRSSRPSLRARFLRLHALPLWCQHFPPQLRFSPRCLPPLCSCSSTSVSPQTLSPQVSAGDVTDVPDQRGSNLLSPPRGSCGNQFNWLITPGACCSPKIVLHLEPDSQAGSCGDAEGSGGALVCGCRMWVLSLVLMKPLGPTSSTGMLLV